MRKKTPSSALLDSTLRIQDGNSPTADIVPSAATMKTAVQHLRTGEPENQSRKHFNLHLPGSHVVRNVFSSNSQLVISRNRLLGDENLSRTRGGAGVPSQFHWCRAFEPCHKCSRTL